MEPNVTKRAMIKDCVEIIGTGNREQCHQAIKKHLFMNELPGNQETLSETGMTGFRVLFLLEHVDHR